MEVLHERSSPTRIHRPHPHSPIAMVSAIKTTNKPVTTADPVSVSKA
ncbi:hypothetical protein [Novipirellula sp.]